MKTMVIAIGGNSLIKDSQHLSEAAAVPGNDLASAFLVEAISATP
jgi:carbamate kinase